MWYDFKIDIKINQYVFLTYIGFNQRVLDVQSALKWQDKTFIVATIRAAVQLILAFLQQCSSLSANFIVQICLIASA